MSLRTAASPLVTATPVDQRSAKHNTRLDEVLRAGLEKKCAIVLAGQHGATKVEPSVTSVKVGKPDNPSSANPDKRKSIVKNQAENNRNGPSLLKLKNYLLGEEKKEEMEEEKKEEKEEEKDIVKNPAGNNRNGPSWPNLMKFLLGEDNERKVFADRTNPTHKRAIAVLAYTELRNWDTFVNQATQTQEDLSRIDKNLAAGYATVLAYFLPLVALKEILPQRDNITEDDVQLEVRISKGNHYFIELKLKGDQNGQESVKAREAIAEKIVIAAGKGNQAALQYWNNVVASIRMELNNATTRRLGGLYAPKENYTMKVYRGIDFGILNVQALITTLSKTFTTTSLSPDVTTLLKEQLLTLNIRPGVSVISVAENIPPEWDLPNKRVIIAPGAEYTVVGQLVEPGYRYIELNVM